MKRVVRLRRTPYVARRKGVLLLLDPHNWIDNRLLALAPYEDEQLAHARAIIASERLDMVVDIGANIGLYTAVLGQLPGVANAVAFEPVRRNHAALMANLYLNGLTGKVDAHRMGLGATAGDVTIHIDPRSTGVSRIDLGTAGRDRSAFTASETIKVARFDDVVAAHGRRAFVKIDVEGHALAVLSGMTRFLAANTVVLQVELDPSESPEVIALLREAGYDLKRRIDADGIFLRMSTSLTQQA